MSEDPSQHKKQIKCSFCESENYTLQISENAQSIGSKYPPFDLICDECGKTTILCVI